MRKFLPVLVTLAYSVPNLGSAQTENLPQDTNSPQENDAPNRLENKTPPSVGESTVLEPLSDEPSFTAQDRLDGTNKIDPTEELREKLERSAKNYYAAAPEGKTLPARVLRVRMPFRVAEATYGYDHKGKKTDIGVSLRALFSALVLEYGATDSISFQYLMPIVYSNKAGLNANVFRQSKDYKKNYEETIIQIVNTLQKNNECSDMASCRELVLSSSAPASAKINTSLPLPNGEILSVNQGVVLKEAADSFVLNAAKPHAGKTGIGDIELGVLWSAISEKSPLLKVPIYYSIGAGIRVPTGQYKNVPMPGFRPTGRGTFDGAIRQNLDYVPMPGLVLAWQNQTEKSFTKVKFQKSSYLDSSKLNTTSPKTYELERKGFRNIGFLKAAWGLGNITQDLNMFGLYSTFKYDVDSAEYENGKAASAGRKQAYSTVIGGTLDLLSKRIPIQFDVDYEVPTGGKNNKLAAQVLGLNLKLFYKF